MKKFSIHPILGICQIPGVIAIIILPLASKIYELKA